MSPQDNDELKDKVDAPAMVEALKSDELKHELEEVEKIAKDIGASQIDPEAIKRGVQERLAKEPVVPAPPTPEEMAHYKETRRQARLYWKVWNYVKGQGRTLKQEYELIVEKKSKMSRAEREYLTAVMLYEPSKEEIDQAKARYEAKQKVIDSMTADHLKEEE